MKIAEINKRFYTVPDNWNELTGRQLIGIIELLTATHSSEYTILRLFKIILGISRWRLFWMPTYEIADNLYLVDFLLTDNTLTENVLPSYRGLYGPRKNFDNLLICEFIFAEAYFMAYDKKPEQIEDGQSAIELTPMQLWAEKKDKETALNKLIAVLYRPSKKNYDRKKNIDGDLREPFKDALTEFYAKKVSHWPQPAKMAIAHWYSGCRLQLVKDFPVVFSQGEKSGEATYGLWSVMRSIAEKGTFGDFATVERQFIKTIMMELTESIRESERLENMTKNSAL